MSRYALAFSSTGIGAFSIRPFPAAQTSAIRRTRHVFAIVIDDFFFPFRFFVAASEAKKAATFADVIAETGVSGLKYSNASLRSWL